MDGDTPGLEERAVLEVLDRWDRRLEAAVAAWGRLPGGEQRRREAELDAGGESDEWVSALWNWWQGVPVPEQEQLRRDVAVLSGALSAAAADGRLDGASEESASARHLLRALERMARILATD
ncbi:MAG TPA: hypothetical protein VFS16_08050 [Acidimicrobiia bacterium]|nr:hypothetical protein [Acidimicrobiia bacterium]